MRTVNALQPDSVEALLHHSADWLWECDAEGHVTCVSGGRLPLSAPLVQALQGHRFEDAGWRLTRQGGEPTSWSRAAGAGGAFDVFASVQDGAATAT